MGPAEAWDVVHGVARQDLVADGEGEAEDDAGLAGAVVALFGELLEEIVASRDPDLAEGDVLEEGQNEGSHVPLVELRGGAGEAIFEVLVLEPVAHQSGERTIGTHPGEPWVEVGGRASVLRLFS